MIKIGRSYFNGNQIAAIQPDLLGENADVYLVRGAVISEHINESALQELLEAAGLLSSTPAAEFLDFTHFEHQELTSAYLDGFLFAAKDKNGHVYAYKKKPEKASCEWGFPDEYVARRLRGDFDCLSFEDEEPLDLEALFSGGRVDEED